MPLYTGDTTQDATRFGAGLHRQVSRLTARLAQESGAAAGGNRLLPPCCSVSGVPRQCSITAVGGSCLRAGLCAGHAGAGRPDEYTHLGRRLGRPWRWNWATAAIKTTACLCAPVMPYFAQNGGHQRLRLQSRRRWSSSRREGPVSTQHLTVLSKAKAGAGQQRYCLPQALGIWLARARGADFTQCCAHGHLRPLSALSGAGALAAGWPQPGCAGLLACVWRCCRCPAAW